MIFFRNFEDKNYQIEADTHNVQGMVTTDRLDKTTSGFRGFDRGKIQLTQSIEIYHPSYLNDGDRETGSITGYYVTDDHTPVMLPVFAYGPGP